MQWNERSGPCWGSEVGLARRDPGQLSSPTEQDRIRNEGFEMENTGCLTSHLTIGILGCYQLV